MHHLNRWTLALVSALVLSLASPAMSSTADAAIWRPIDARTLAPQPDRPTVPRAYRSFALDLAALRARLAAAPPERGAAARRAAALLPLPLPDGSLGRFAISESPIMEPGLAAQYPQIKTYVGQGVDDPTATVRLDLTPSGFHAMILAETGTVFVDPYSRTDTARYLSYYKRDYQPPAGKTIEEQVIDRAVPRPKIAPAVSSGGSLRTYRLAVAATGEYTAFTGGTVAGALAAITTTINRVNAVYERDLAVRLLLVANNALVIYTDANTDPYTNSDGSLMLDQNQANLDLVIGSANYDIGHVFSTGGGGIASLAAVCSGAFKAQGVTGSPSPVGDPFDIDYVAHEIGHQFGANHTFNTGNAGACAGNRNGTTAYEVGSGSTIMAYAGICAPENLQANSDSYFHGVNLDEIIAFATAGGGSSCAVTVANGNSAPVVEAGPSYTIPARTPFTLTGSATDANGDALTYAWEQFNLGAAASPNTDTGSNPLFRSFTPAGSPARTLPKLSDLVNNTSTIGELLPTTSRVLTFRLTARDNRAGGGGFGSDLMNVTVVNTLSPFSVTAPNTAVTWVGATEETVTWDVAGTDQAPVSCANVAILLSTDGGLTFPTTVLASTPNDGTQAITVPNTATSSARLKVACAGNIFFDISNANFTIQAIMLATVSAGAAPAEPSTDGSFVVTLSQPAPVGGLTLSYTVDAGGGAATPDVDYVALSGSVDIPAGATTASIPVVVIADDVDDPGETVSIALAAGAGYTVGAQGSATVTIGVGYSVFAPTVSG